MIAAPNHPHENLRLAVLRDSGLLDRKTEEIYDDFVLIASVIAETPIALISLVDRDQQWFKARIGLEVESTPRSVSFCAHAINDSGRATLVEDAHKDSRFADNPLVIGDPHIRFYYGMPIHVSERHLPVGTLCVIDNKPRVLSEDKLRALQALNRMIERSIAKS